MSVMQYQPSAVERVVPALTIQVLREQIAPEATNTELAYFGQVCRALDLSPFADQIVLIGRWDKRLRRKVHRHQITVAGRRALATRTGELAGIEGPVWSGPRNDNGELVWREVWDDDEPPYCARVLVHRHRCVVPFNGTAKWSEMAQYDNEGKLLPLWRQMPSHMLGKVAESLALRRAFGDVVTPDAVSGFTDEDDSELVEATGVNAIDVDEATGEITSGATGPLGVSVVGDGDASYPVPAHPGDAEPAAGVEYQPRVRSCVRCGGPLGTDPLEPAAGGWAHKGGCPSTKDERV